MNIAEEKQFHRAEAYTTPRPDVFAMVPPHARTILDVGCSNGALGVSLRFACEGRRVFGIEIDAAFAEKARNQIDGVTCADLNHFDWTEFMPGQEFDCIIFADVLEHLIAPSEHLQAARQRLSCGGCIVISLPNIRHISSFLSIFLKGTFPLRDRGIFDRTHIRWFTIADARRMVETLSMRVDDISYALRAGDNGGGNLNRFINRFLGPIAGIGIIREFLTYQFCIRIVVAK